MKPFLAAEKNAHLNILDTVHFPSVEDLAKYVAVCGGRFVIWAEGIVYFYLESSVDDKRKVFRHRKINFFFSTIFYAEMPTFQPLIETKERIQLAVFDFSTSIMMPQLAKAVKEFNKG